MPAGAGWLASVLDHFVEARETELKLIATNYQVYSVLGASFPVGKCFYPPVFRILSSSTQTTLA